MALSPGMKRPVYESDHTCPSRAEVKNACSLTPPPLHTRIHGVAVNDLW